MKRSIAVLLTVAGLMGAAPAFAQESGAPGAGSVDVTVIPGGAMFFTEAKDTTNGPSFGNYNLGGALSANVSRFVGVEGEFEGALGISQDLQLGSITSKTKTPDLLNYSGNLVINAANKSSVVPYVTGGVGGLTVFDKAELGINQTQTFLTGNVGGGVKWYSGRWGLRGDYRFIGVRSKNDAPSFFGQETRYGHRVYGALILNVRR